MNAPRPVALKRYLMDIFTFLLSSLMVFANPQEQFLYNANSVPNIEISISNNTYSLNCSFIVKNILYSDNYYSVSIIDENNVEITFTGMQEVFVSVSDKKYSAGQKIGKDYSLTEFTKYLIMPYKKNDHFPQFINNKLIFDYKIGTPIFALTDGEVEKVNYSNTTGNTISQKIIDSSQNIADFNDTIIEYWHLQTIRVIKSDPLEINNIIANSGNTGLTHAPHLSIFFHSTDYFYDYKIIYIRASL
jgi:hypothetical protein